MNWIEKWCENRTALLRLKRKEEGLRGEARDILLRLAEEEEEWRRDVLLRLREEDELELCRQRELLLRLREEELLLKEGEKKEGEK